MDKGMQLVLFYWLKDTAAGGYEKMYAAAKEMKGAAKVVDVKIGKPHVMGDHIMDETYDIAVEISLADAENFKAVFESEEHKAFGAVCGDYVKKVQGYTIEY